MSEDETIEARGAMPAPKMKTPTSVEPTLINNSIDTMKVKELKDALSRSGVIQSGNKAVLDENSKEVVTNGVPVMESQPVEASISRSIQEQASISGWCGVCK